MALEEHLDVLLGRGEGQIAHVDRRHPDFSLKMRAAEGAVPCMYRGQLKTGQGFKAHVGVHLSLRCSWGPAACTVVR
jgi:hypothetical protein